MHLRFTLRVIAVRCEVCGRRLTGQLNLLFRTKRRLKPHQFLYCVQLKRTSSVIKLKQNFAKAL